MSYEVPIINLLTKAISAALNHVKLSSGRRNGARLISEATQELLSLSPRIARVNALLERAEQVLPDKPIELYQARALLDAVAKATARPADGQVRPGRRVARRKAAKKKAAKK